MSEPMGLFVAIRDYVNRDANVKVDLAELKAFKDACSDQDRKDYTAEMESYGYTIR